MSNALDWHKFYFKRWDEDEFVKVSDVETIGAYILLLTHQMAEGDVPDDIDKLAVLVGHGMSKERFLDIWERRGLRMKFTPVDEEWVSTGRDLDDGHWVKCEGRAGRLQNRFMAKVISIDKKNRAANSLGGRRSVETRRSMEDALSGKKDPGPADVDVQPILRAYPKTANNGGWSYGVAMVSAAVSTIEERDQLLSAVQNYARKTRGFDRTKIKRLDNFMREWRDWLPGDRQLNGEVSPVAAAPAPSAPAEQPAVTGFPPEWCRPDDAVRVLEGGDKPPWILGRYAKDDERARISRTYPDEATKHRWWRGEVILDPQVH